MLRVLHILTGNPEPLATQLIQMQKRVPGQKVIVVHLAGDGRQAPAGPNADYGQVLEEIFKADSIQVW